MIKNYKEEVFTDLTNAIIKHSNNSNSSYVLIKMINEANELVPGLKNTFIHDMGSFLTHWFNIVNDSKSCSTKLRAKILTIDMMMKFSDFNNFILFCYDKMEEVQNPHTNNSYSRDLMSYLACVIKAIIQSERRAIGLDANSKKYGKTATETK